MKTLTLSLFLLVGLTAFGQVPAEFNVSTYNNADSAVILLTKLARQQCKPIPTSIDITKEYISQNRSAKKTNAITGNVRSEVISKSIYFENIDRVDVRKSTAYKIYFFSNKTGSKDVIMLKDKEMAEQAYAAIICLIKNSGNTCFK